MTSQPSPRAQLLAEFLTGLVAAIPAVTLILALKVIVNVPTLPELAQDRMLQHVPGPVFAYMLENLLYLGKPALFISLLALQVVVMAAIAIPALQSRRPLEVAAVLWLITGLLLLPLVGRGVFDQRLDVAVVNFAAFAIYGGLLFALPRLRRDASATDEAPAPPRTSGVTRRELIGGGIMLAVSAVFAKLAIGTLPKRPGINPDGLPEPITPTGIFYIVSKNLFDPDVESGGWHLRVDGLVNTPLMLSYKDMLDMPSEEFVRTMECISNEVGGDLIGTGRFTGVHLSDVLKRAGLKPDAKALHFTSEDDYTETMTLEQAMAPETFLVHQLNGAPLPMKHGYPLRVLGAGTYGMKNPKWLTRIEVTTANPPEGFWEHQGWDPGAQIQTMSRIDSPRKPSAAGSVTIQGIAFAGNRGVQTVELSKDNGETWQPVKLLPTLGPLTWVFWQYAVDLAAGAYRLVVRATDGKGTLQDDRDYSPYPSGATGYHKLRLEITDQKQTEAPKQEGNS